MLVIAAGDKRVRVRHNTFIGGVSMNKKCSAEKKVDRKDQHQHTYYSQASVFH
jgi:hypothetical protein